ncbi:MAG: hypothetical protein GFH27_549287n42 [Chloroflexi bacterium AL-W]|nr:hypothetical protein [Chloroflexi bacterium AL-N1]NOK66316.1 hypothetical protein [Chloroflexi bacterium AL-N10]NOK71704.1 hypothetical protein [Chloroflexi bacterium AL-N5]NOK80961.1 hypothetical protein [Chloroflexi bacterium AL-W]NOK89234.1 hypothetical protein [Chloroflexi bacterium AL-N15]
MRSMDTSLSRYRWLISLFVVFGLAVMSLIGMPNSVAQSVADNASGSAVQSIATASYDVGENDFRISDMGPYGDIWSEIMSPSAVAYNSQNNQHLVVWAANDDPTGPVHIYGQRLDATTGAEIGTNDFQINQTLPPSFLPDVTYNPITNEYMVVWANGDFRNPALAPYGIFAQRIDAATGDNVGVNNFRIDTPPSEPGYHVTTPDVTYNSTMNEYLVVWRRYPVDKYSESEMIGQRLAANGTRIGQPITSISDTTLIDFDVAHHAITNEYMVVWSILPINNTTNIYAQRLDATTGAQVGTNDARISDMKQEDHYYSAPDLAIVYNKTTDEYLVVWGGNTGQFSDYQIHGQRLSATGGEVGEDNFAISQITSPNGLYLTGPPAVAYNSPSNQYLVAWTIGRFFHPMDDIEFELYGQLLDGRTGAEIGIDDVRISDMGPEGHPSYYADSPALASNEQNNEYIAIWQGEDNTGTLVEDEMEVFGQCLAVPWEPTPTPTATATPTATSTPPPTTIPPTATPTPTPDLPPIEPSRSFLPLLIR